MKIFFNCIVFVLLNCFVGYSQNTSDNSIPFLWDELSTPQFEKAIQKSDSICIIPMGIIEKHGPHLPLSTDLIIAREIVKRAALQEYVLVYPPYYFGQIFEAQHKKGTIAYSTDLMMQMLQETCDELYRNGIRQILLVSGHGGNNSFISFFCQSQLSKKRNYTVINFTPDDTKIEEGARKLKKTEMDAHAGETESSMIYAIRPELVDTDAAKNESGQDQNRLGEMPYASTAIWWYAKFPNHYGGDGSYVSKELGNFLIDNYASQLVELIKYLKDNNTVLELQNEFFERQ